MAGEQYWSEEAEFEAIRTVVVKPHRATDDSQLELQVNDIVCVLEKDETGWWGGHKDGEEFTGWFPGSCVRELPPGDHNPDLSAVAGSTTTVSVDEPEVTTKLNEASARNSALETEISSPVRQNYAVASPQRPSLAAVQGALSMTPATAEAAGAACHRRASVIEESQTLGMENAHLKREKQALEEALKKLQRQSDVDRRNYHEMEAEKEKLEMQLQVALDRREDIEKKSFKLAEQAEVERRKAERLEDELRRKDQEMESLKRMSVVSAVPAASPSPSPKDEVKGASEPRRRLFNSMTNAAGATAAAAAMADDSRLTVIAASPSPEPARGRLAYSASPSPPLPSEKASYRPAESSAVVRASSTSSLRPAEEEPPAGVVKQLRDAFESRTPRRSNSQTSVRSTYGQDRSSRSAASASRQPSVSTAPLQARNGRFPPRPIATDVPKGQAAEETNFGMSPIHLGEASRRREISATHGRY